MRQCRSRAFNFLSDLSYVALIEIIKPGSVEITYCLGTLVDRSTLLSSPDCLQPYFDPKENWMAERAQFQHYLLIKVKILRSDQTAQLNSVYTNELESYEVTAISMIQYTNNKGMMIVRIENEKSLPYAQYTCLDTDLVSFDNGIFTIGLFLSSRLESKHNGQMLTLMPASFFYTPGFMCDESKLDDTWNCLSSDFANRQNINNQTKLFQNGEFLIFNKLLHTFKN